MQVLAIAALLAVTLEAQEARPLAAAQMADDLRQLAHEAESQWAYAEARRAADGLDLAQLAETMVARLTDSTSDADHAALLREFVAALRDGHAYVEWSRADRQRFRRWPFTFVDVAEGVMVDRALPAWDGSAVDLRRGDLLLAVDGVLVADLIADVERRTPASTPAARRRLALADAALGERDPMRYRVRRADGSEVEVEARSAAGEHMFPERVDQGVASRTLEGGVGYVRIPTLAHRDQAAWQRAAPGDRQALLAEEVRAIRAAFAPFAAARAVVLDLRGNAGGTDLLGRAVAACLLPSDAVYYRLSSRRATGGWTPPWPVPIAVPEDSPRVRGRLIVLIDAGVFSAADNLCRCLDDLHPQVTFVGGATGGGSGAPRPLVTLRHSRAVVTFCTMRVFGPNGAPIEGVGTRPDVPVAPTCAGVLAGRDEVLDAAVALLH